MGPTPRSVVVRVPGEVLMQSLPDDEAVFLNLATEEYYGLNATGTAMWRALTETGRVDLARDRLLDQFDVDRKTLDGDLEAFVSGLVERGLLRVDDGSE